MYKLKRLLAICIAMVTVPVFTMEGTPYRATDNGEMVKASTAEDCVRAEEECGTEETTTTTLVTTTTLTTTTTTTTTTCTTTTDETTTTTTEVTYCEPHLNPHDGIVHADQTPSGYEESFYNLPMFGCLDLLGYSHDGYEERFDGVKTYNGYVMVATPDLEAHPKGSLIPTTLGMGIVVDFCPIGRLDVAVTWE
ncbi:MAG: hypothetical protein IKE91_05565 [Clostridia bacterium]|nr:hypothetical protein [Clostridia bacterium]